MWLIHSKSLKLRNSHAPTVRRPVLPLYLVSHHCRVIHQLLLYCWSLFLTLFLIVLALSTLMFEHAYIFPPGSRTVPPCTPHRFLQSKVRNPMCTGRPSRYTCISCHILGYTGIFCDIPSHTTLYFDTYISYLSICSSCWKLEHTYINLPYTLHSILHWQSKLKKINLQAWHQIYLYTLVYPSIY
jgi:hypothetical protein